MCKAVVFYVLNRTVSCSLLVCGDIGNRSKQPAWTHIHTLCHLPTVHLGQKLCTISNSSPANPNPPRSAPAQREMTPLHLVANLGLAEVVNVLLEAGADKEARNVSRRKLHTHTHEMGLEARERLCLKCLQTGGRVAQERDVRCRLSCTAHARARARAHTHTHTHTHNSIKMPARGTAYRCTRLLALSSALACRRARAAGCKRLEARGPEWSRRLSPTRCCCRVSCGCAASHLPAATHLAGIFTAPTPTPALIRYRLSCRPAAVQGKDSTALRRGEG